MTSIASPRGGSNAAATGTKPALSWDWPVREHFLLSDWAVREPFLFSDWVLREPFLLSNWTVRELTLSKGAHFVLGLVSRRIMSELWLGSHRALSTDWSVPVLSESGLDS